MGVPERCNFIYIYIKAEVETKDLDCGEWEGTEQLMVRAHSHLLFSCYLMSDSCDPINCSPLGSSVHGIFQARILEWVAISSYRGSS